MSQIIANMSTEELELWSANMEDHDCTYENDCTGCKLWGKIERELDARELWDADDARVRESVGNYR